MLFYRLMRCESRFTDKENPSVFSEAEQRVLLVACIQTMICSRILILPKYKDVKPNSCLVYLFDGQVNRTLTDYTSAKNIAYGTLPFQGEKCSSCGRKQNHHSHSPFGQNCSLEPLWNYNANYMKPVPRTTTITHF